jgi:hypothetical protein
LVVSSLFGAVYFVGLVLLDMGAMEAGGMGVT